MRKNDIKPENRSRPREKAETEGLLLNVERRTDLGATFPGYWPCVYGGSLSGSTLRGGNAGTVPGGGASGYTLKNCIRFSNSGDGDFGSPGALAGNNWIGDPLFVDAASGNLRLQSNSPCINAGNISYLTNSYFTNCFDLDGNLRIQGGMVDIGAYEFQSSASMISYAWLQRFNLPINPATDTADPDGDGVNNYREWLAGGDPTKPFSFLSLLTLIPYGANVILTWPTNAVGCTLQSTTNLGSAVWNTNSPAQAVIGGQNTVTNLISGAQQFFRLKH